MSPRDLKFPAGLIMPGMVNGILMNNMERWRKDQENKPLPKRLGLGSLLNTCPTPWIDAIHQQVVGPTHRSTVKTRRDAVLAALRDQVILTRVVARLEPDCRDLLLHLVDKGEPERLTAIHRRFGSDAGDGWFWNETPPRSTLGRLRLRGLAFVGILAGSTRKDRFVALPGDLVVGLRQFIESQGH